MPHLALRLNIPSIFYIDASIEYAEDYGVLFLGDPVYFNGSLVTFKV